jgi:hypothetical protein
LAAVQVWFREGDHRDYLIYDSPARFDGKATREPQWSVRSFAGPGKRGALDLRDLGQAAEVAAVLAALPLGG